MRACISLAASAGVLISPRVADERSQQSFFVRAEKEGRGAGFVMREQPSQPSNYPQHLPLPQGRCNKAYTHSTEGGLEGKSKDKTRQRQVAWKGRNLLSRRVKEGETAWLVCLDGLFGLGVEYQWRDF
jgi:hypothetical protein